MDGIFWRLLEAYAASTAGLHENLVGGLLKEYQREVLEMLDTQVEQAKRKGVPKVWCKEAPMKATDVARQLAE